MSGISRIAGRVVAAAPRFRAVLVPLALFLVVSTATRLVLLVEHDALRRDAPGTVAAALAVGVVLDLLAGLWLVLPLSLVLALLPERWLRRRAVRVLLLAALGGAAFAALFVAAAEVLFFAELDSRFNFIAVDYLMYPTEVSANIWESYPTGLLLGSFAVAAIGATLLMRRLLAPAWVMPTPPRARAAALLAHALLLAGMTAVIPASFARVSADRALDEIADNGYRTFVAALAGSHATYAGLYPTSTLADDLRRLRPLLAEPALDAGSFVPASTLRHLRPAGPERRLNVVVVLEESLGAELVGALDPRAAAAGLTPSFDRLARDGTLLTRAYSTGNRTVRAIEATTASIPPLPGISIVRRPQSSHLFTLPELLRQRGYRTLFVYGGRALFDGMGGYLTRNGVERVVEQADYPATAFRTAWGVADEHVFDRALEEMDALAARDQPFYALLLTTSNHRPFAFPTTHVRWDPRLQRRENAVRYADWALGRFLREAEGHPFFYRTLFVVMGDHGARVYGAAEIPLPSYHVPVLFYAPGLVAAGRLDLLASSLDVPPTVLGLLGLDYQTRFFGHDLFHAPTGSGRALMTHNSDIALLRGGRLAVLGLRGARSVYACDERDDCRPARLDDRGRQLLADAVAYYDAADRLYGSGGWAALPTAAEQRVLLARGRQPPAGRPPTSPARSVAAAAAGG